MHRNHYIIQICLLLLVSSCGGLKPSKKSNSGSTPDSLDQVAEKKKTSKKRKNGEISEEIGLSLQSKLRLKTAERLSRDLASGLELRESELCFELGNLSCFDKVHKIELGGVEAYELNIYNGTKEVSISMPLVIDRIVLAACESRIEKDFSGSGIIFKGDDKEAIRSLYQRAYLRNPSDDELGASLDFAKDFAGDEKKWALSQCFAVFSSAEFLFY